MDTEIVKEDLRKWFKDGGWNRYNTKGEKVGKCAREDKDGDGKADGPKPKCLPASKAASLGKKKVAAAVKRKRAEDPNPERTGAAKNVKTESVEVNEVLGTTIAGTVGAATAKKKDRVRKAVGTGAGYAVGSTIGKGVGAGAAGGVPIVGGLLKGAGGALGSVAGGVGGAVVGNKLAGETKKKKKTNEEIEVRVGDFMEACWKGYEKKGMKTMFGKRYPNCVKKTTKEETELAEAPVEAPPKKPLKDTGNPVQNAWNKFVPPRESSANPNVRSGLRQPGKLEKPALDALNKGAETANKPIKAASKAVKTVQKGADAVGNAAKATGDFIKNNPGKAAAIGAGVVGAGLLAKKVLGGDKKKEQQEHSAWRSELNYVEEGEGKKDACYHKVKASAKVWPSAYASGRLVQCRKKGAANYGNSKKD